MAFCHHVDGEKDAQGTQDAALPVTCSDGEKEKRPHTSTEPAPKAYSLCLIFGQWKPTYPTKDAHWELQELEEDLPFRRMQTEHSTRVILFTLINHEETFFSNSTHQKFRAKSRYS